MSTVEPKRFELVTSWKAGVLELAEQLTENLDTNGLIELVKRINVMAGDHEFATEMRAYFQRQVNP